MNDEIMTLIDMNYEVDCLDFAGSDSHSWGYIQFLQGKILEHTKYLESLRSNNEP